MARPTSNSHDLTLGQGIGIGVAVGFLGALMLAAIVFCLARTRRFRFHFRPARPPTPPPPPTRPQAVTSGGDDAVHVSTADEDIVWIRQPNSQGVLKWRPNPPYKNIKSLICHMSPVMGRDAIHDATLFHFDIDQLVTGCLESYYFTNRMPQVQESDFDEDQLARLAGEPVNGGTWSELISNRKTRGPAVRCFLAQIIFKRIHPLSDIEETLLPLEIATMYQLLDRVVGPLKENPTRGERMGQDTLAVWREVSWLLLRHVYHLGSARPGRFGGEDPRKERVYALMSKAMDALKLETLNTSKRPEELQIRMQGVFESAAQSAMILFSQPCTWEFEWVSEEEGFMTFPAIRLIWDEDHVKYSKPAEVVNPRYFRTYFGE